MPFESKSQLIACLYAQERSKHKKKRDRSGKEWDCMESLRETRHFDRLPWKVGCKAEPKKKKTSKKGKERASSSKKGNERASSSSSDLIHTGPRGGKYVVRAGKKVYV
jgi:hypothetical protein